MAKTCEPESRSGAGHSSAVCDQGVLLNGTEAATQRNSNRPAQIGNKSLRERMITIMAITLVMVGRSLIFRNFMPDREEDPKPGAWDGKGRMSRRTADYTCPARRGSLRVSRCPRLLAGTGARPRGGGPGRLARRGPRSAWQGVRRGGGRLGTARRPTPRSRTAWTYPQTVDRRAGS